METSDASRTGAEEQGLAPRLLRERSRAELLEQAQALPNILTLLRIGSVPFLIWAVATGRPVLAAGLFIGASLTDGLDGFLARTLRQQTELGAFIDPVADKLLTLSALIALTLERRLPGWLLGVVLVRDGGIVVASLILRKSGKIVPSRPTWLGKSATFFLFVTMGLAFLQGARGSPELARAIEATGIIAAACVLGAATQYFSRWLRLMRSDAQARSAPPPHTRSRSRLASHPRAEPRHDERASRL